MIEAVETARHVTVAEWGIAIFAVLPLAIGLTLIIWPRQANYIMWKVHQGVYRLNGRKPPPFGIAIALGCFFLLFAVALFWGAWVGSQ